MNSDSYPKDSKIFTTVIYKPKLSSILFVLIHMNPGLIEIFIFVEKKYINK